MLTGKNTLNTIRITVLVSPQRSCYFFVGQINYKWYIITQWADIYHFSQQKIKPRVLFKYLELNLFF